MVGSGWGAKGRRRDADFLSVWNQEEVRIAAESGKSLPSLEGHHTYSVPHYRAAEDWGRLRDYKSKFITYVQVHSSVPWSM